MTAQGPRELHTDTLRAELVGRVGIIRFNRPDRRNALHDDMYAPMMATIEEWAAADDVGCIVVTGEGAAFCAGGDVRDGSGRRGDGPKPTLDERAAGLAANARLSVLLHEAPIVTIAAVNGPAVGAGLAIALACDIRVATRSARFVGGWARLGFSGDFGGAWLLANRIGPSKALEVLALNRSVEADEAHRLGMVDHVVDDEEFAATWTALAEQFAAGPRLAIASMKANVAEASRLGLAEAIERESQRMVATSLTRDHREAVRAWMEKREPRFGLPPEG